MVQIYLKILNFNSSLFLLDTSEVSFIFLIEEYFGNR